MSSDGSGDYRVPSGKTPGGKHRPAWKEILGEKLEARRAELRRHPSPPAEPELTARAREAVVEDYRARGYDLTWNDLELDGEEWEEHHIHEASWRGHPTSKENLIFLRKGEHLHFTLWWSSRRREIERELKKEEEDP